MTRPDARPRRERQMTADDWVMLKDLMDLQTQVVLHGAAYVRARLKEARDAH